MSEVDKDNKEFEFIKEQILPKRRKKFRKWLVPFIMTIIMAIVFGLVAALTFCISEPTIYRLLHKDEPNPFVIPTPSPNDNDSGEEDPDYTEEPLKEEDDEPSPSDSVGASDKSEIMKTIIPTP